MGDSVSAEGVVSSAPVIVRSASGELTGVAKIDDSMRRGVSLHPA
jgi:hypothetical protein